MRTARTKLIAPGQPDFPSTAIAAPVPMGNPGEEEQDQDEERVKSDLERRLWQSRQQGVGLGRVEAPVEKLEVEVHPLPRGVRLGTVRAQEIGGDHRRNHAGDDQAHQHRGTTVKPKP